MEHVQNPVISRRNPFLIHYIAIKGLTVTVAHMLPFEGIVFLANKDFWNFLEFFALKSEKWT